VINLTYMLRGPQAPDLCSVWIILRSGSVPRWQLCGQSTWYLLASTQSGR